MSAQEIIAVVGVCAPERRRIALHLASQQQCPLVTTTELQDSSHPIEAALDIAANRSDNVSAMIEFPIEVLVTEIIGTCDDATSNVELEAVVCVVDAAYLLMDLANEEYVARRTDTHANVVEHTARALLTVTQMEYASSVVLVNWETLSPEDCSLTMSCVAAIAPHAHIALHTGTSNIDVLADGGPVVDRPGWVQILNGTHTPALTNPHVQAFRYEQFRPFHPDRLNRILDTQLGSGKLGTVLRSSGFCRLATRPNVTAQWEHVGQMISFMPMQHDRDVQHPDDLLAFGQELAVIGIDLKQQAITAALDAAALTDDELLKGPMARWNYPDPFPTWDHIVDEMEG